MASSEPRKTDQCQALYSNQQTDTEFFPRKTRCAPKHSIHHIHLSLFAFDHLHARPTTILSCLYRLIQWCFFKLSLPSVVPFALPTILSLVRYMTRQDGLVSNCCVWITALFLFLTSAPRLLLCHSATLPAISLRKLVCQYLILGSCICCFCCFHWCCVALHWLYETFGDTSLLLINTTHASVAIWRVAN